jgi:hypothetical protein
VAPSFVWVNFCVCCRCACSTPTGQIGQAGRPDAPERHNTSCHSGRHENASDLSLRLTAPLQPPPHRAKRALGTPGLRQCGVGLNLRLPSPYPSSRFARLGNGAGLTYAAPNGARVWCVTNLRGSRLHFRETTKDTKGHKGNTASLTALF